MKTPSLLATSALALSLFTFAQQAQAQGKPADGFLALYPELSALEDQSCLKRLERFEARQGAEALRKLAAEDLDAEALGKMPLPLAECVLAADAILDGEIPAEGETEAVTETPPAAEAASEAPADPPADQAQAGDAQAEAAESDADAGTDTTAGDETAAMEDAAADDAGAAPEGEVSGTSEVSAEAEVESTPEVAADTEASAETGAASNATADDADQADATAETDAEAEVALEAVQTDTEAATEAANETVEAEAAVADTAEAKTVETEVVTEETSRSSNEDFKKRERRAARQAGQSATASADTSAEADDDGLDIGQIAAGVLGGIVLSEILGANEKVVEDTGDRVVVQRGDGDFYVLKDDDALLRQPGTEISTEHFADGSTRRTATRPDGTKVVTIRAANGQVLRRTRILPDGTEFVLFDDTVEVAPVEVATLSEADVTDTITVTEMLEEDALRRALADTETADVGRRFSLAQIRNIRAVRALVPTIELESVTFDTGSAAIRATEAEELAAIGRVLRDIIAENPDEVFLIEGHTDAVGSASYNLALSDRRAESVALALTEYFDVPPENMVVQGYGESALKVPTPDAERANRRAAVRRITPLLNGTSTF